MIVFAILLGITGLILSGLFSGTEMGFYRVPRIRVQLDAIEGRRSSQWLLWLINRPSLFIATILIGNNIANYLVSMSGVFFVQAMFEPTGNSPEILATLILTPLLFVYGEMFPKYVFMQIPETALKYTTPIFFVFLALFLPISIFVWALNRGLSLLLDEKEKPLRLRLARHEISRRFDEGQEAGLILPAQRILARNVFQTASRSILHDVTPIADYPAIKRSTPPREMLALAESLAISEFPVFSDWNAKQPVGYVRTIELALAVRQSKSNKNREKTTTERAAISEAELTSADSDISTGDAETPVRELLEFDDDHSPLNVLLLFQATGESVALVVGENDKIHGLISEKRLLHTMFSGKNFNEFNVLRNTG
ncbi:MAG: CNNM domain-containing protein [Planctomycetaceae bacterium]|jgi:CBS domain containing-hemolysin-like protein|nr:CNNM domain-containing protein [Planctomycetaceae bacterium]